MRQFKSFYYIILRSVKYLTYLLNSYFPALTRKPKWLVQILNEPVISKNRFTVVLLFPVIFFLINWRKTLSLQCAGFFMAEFNVSMYEPWNYLILRKKCNYEFMKWTCDFAYGFFKSLWWHFSKVHFGIKRDN